LIFPLIVGCNTTQNTTTNRGEEVKEMMNSWMGSTKHELLLQWGVPYRTSTDGNRGEILTFATQKGAYHPNFGYTTVTHNYLFYVDSKGIIYHWKYYKDVNRR